MNKEKQGKAVFVSFCIEQYAKAKNVSTEDVVNLFEQYGIAEHFCEFYEVLHTQGGQWLIEEIDNMNDDGNPAKVFKAIGTAFSENVGGAAGPLYAAAFNRAAKACDENTSFTVDSVIKVLGEAIEAIKKRGRVEPGEKTMLDVLIPVHTAFVKGKEKDLTLFQCLGEASRAAKEGAAT